jgi:1,4-dihydroxy-2-naphthoyl-CoA hydrolase
MEIELPEDFDLPISRFDELIGTEWVSDDPDRAIARIRMRDELRQPIGLLHGGVYSTVIESLCSRATALAVLPKGKTCMGQSINVNFLRAITEGGAEIRAEAVHRGRSTWVWRAEVVDDQERLCATGLMTVAVRDLPQEIIDRFGPGSQGS